MGGRIFKELIKCGIMVKGFARQMRKMLALSLRGMILCIVCICASSLLLSCAFLELLFPPEELPFGVKNRSVLYVYDSEETIARDYRYLLQDGGYSVDILHVTDVVFTDLSTYGVLIAGPDSGTSGGWGYSDNVLAVQDSGLPVIGLGAGGTILFEQLGLNIGYPNSMFFSDGELYVTDARHVIFNEPQIINVADTHIIRLYMSAECIGVYEGNLPPEIARYGRSILYPSHYTLVREERFLLWGYSDSPATMTETGKNLFINVMRFMNEEIGITSALASPNWKSRCSTARIGFNTPEDQTLMLLSSTRSTITASVIQQLWYGSVFCFDR
jgi:hypothetical protein